MLSVTIDSQGLEEFSNKLGNLQNGGLFVDGFHKFTDEARRIAIEGTHIGDSRDYHPGLMKKSWEEPVYTTDGSYYKATITNSVEYGMAENYGHFQTPGLYVPAIGKRLVHFWVPGTYALEASMDKAELKWESVVRPEIVRKWYDKVESDDPYVDVFRQTFYDSPYGELDDE